MIWIWNFLGRIWFNTFNNSNLPGVRYFLISWYIHTSYLSFFYTTAIWGVEILHLKVRKFATKVASRQSIVNYHPRTQIINYVKMIACLSKTKKWWPPSLLSSTAYQMYFLTPEGNTHIFSTYFCTTFCTKQRLNVFITPTKW